MDYINQAGKKANQLAKKYIYILEIKPCELGSGIRDVEAFWYKTEIKIIYFMPLCLIVLIVSDSMVYPDPKYKKIDIKKLGSG